MKIKRFNENKFVPATNNMLEYLPDDRLKESIETFEHILNCMTSILDNYEVRFIGRYGSQITMTYDDYKEKNNKYTIFINGFPILGYSVDIYIIINKYDIDLISEILSNDYYEFIKRMEVSDSVLKHKKTDISINNEDSTYKTKMRISIELSE